MKILSFCLFFPRIARYFLTLFIFHMYFFTLFVIV